MVKPADSFTTGVKRYRPLRNALRRRRRLRAGLIQAIYIAVGLGLAIAAPSFTAGREVDAAGAAALLSGLAGGLVSFIALVFSMLFLVVPYANTSLTPRLNTFRNSPLVWHSFGMFVGTFVYATGAAIAISGKGEVSIGIPIFGITLVVISFAVSRALQMSAYKSLQLSTTLLDVTDRGRTVLRMIYREPFADDRPEPLELPLLREELTWPHRLATLQQIDLPRLIGEANRLDAVIVVRVPVGAEIAEGATILAIHGGNGTIPKDHLARYVETGPERSFDQDPLFAFRLLVDIGLRALSAAVNDPTTAVQVIGCVDDLLGEVVNCELDIGHVTGEHGLVRVVVQLPTWDDFLDLAIDELAYYSVTSPPASRRLLAMLDHLIALAPEARRQALRERRDALAAHARPLRLSTP